MGVLDIGSNTGHLLIVDAFRGAPPVPAHSFKEPLRLAESLDADQQMTADGTAALVKYVTEATAEAEDKGCDEVIAFATSAVREAANADEVIAAVNTATGIDLRVLPGEDEARLTFLAARRWLGWSAGRLGMLDIGGGSLEMAVGSDEEPETAVSLPLGAGRLTRERLDAGQNPRELRRYVRREIGQVAGSLLRGGPVDRAVATSKTFRSLARIAGAAPRADGPYVKRSLKLRDLRKIVDQLSTMTSAEVQRLPGVSEGRAHQMLAGAIVAEAAAELTGVTDLLICPWALREGVLLEAIDQL